MLNTCSFFFKFVIKKRSRGVVKKNGFLILFEKFMNLFIYKLVNKYDIFFEGLLFYSCRVLVFVE